MVVQKKLLEILVLRTNNRNQTVHISIYKQWYGNTVVKWPFWPEFKWTRVLGTVEKNNSAVPLINSKNQK